MIQNKKGKGLLLVIIGLVFIFMMPVSAFAMTGTETSADPYMIYNAADLQNIQNNLTANFKLANDIDLSGVNFTPIGNTNTPFKGTLDGAGHTIKNLSINSTVSSTGLFSSTLGSTIKNLNIIVKEIKSNQYHTGSLVGYAYETLISNVHTRKADNNSIISGMSWVGGVAGLAYYSDIVNCSSNINISGGGAGGLIGDCQSSSIDKSYATGNVTGGSSGSTVGGLFGITFGDVISNSYAQGNVSGNTRVGGFIGDAAGEECITNCYSTGQVSGSSTDVGAFSGGYYGYESIANCYYDSSKVSRTGMGDSPITPMTHEASFHQATYVGFDFNSIWTIDEGTSTPYLRDMPSPYPSSNADLRGLSVGQNPPGLTPSFAGTTTSYTLNLGNLTVTPVAADAHATITVNGQNVVSGTPSQSIPLASGIITIIVTAEDGVTTKTYTINI